MGTLNEILKPMLRGLINASRLEHLTQQVFPVRMPLRIVKSKDWNLFGAFRGKTPNIWELGCHLSVLAPGKIPHLPCSHKEEEIIVLLSGRMEIIILDSESPTEREKRYELHPNEIVYYPSHLIHTNQNIGNSEAVYCVFKWYLPNSMFRCGSQFGIYSYSEEMNNTPENGKGFETTEIFGFPTDQLSRFHCHISTMSPGAGYEPHADNYDVAIIILKGELETLGKTVSGNDIIFYPAGEPHGMKNNSNETAVYLAFEFHRTGINLTLNTAISSVKRKIFDK